jgi:hypothetical protein
MLAFAARGSDRAGRHFSPAATEENFKMLLALVVLLFPVPQAHSAMTDSADSKPVVSAAVRPLLLPKATSPGLRSTEPETAVPDLLLTNSFSSDVPTITSRKHAEPPAPENYFPASPIPHLTAALLTSTNTFEAPIKPATLTAHRETVANRRLWYGLLAAGHSAAVWDAYSTRRVMSRNLGTERNPLLRPFANSNSLYFAVQASPLLMDFLGRKMMTSEHPWVRHMWWLPQSTGTAASLLSGIHNLHISQ